MWTLIKSHPWTAAAGGLILLLAIVGVIVGVVTKGRWADRGLMVREGKRLRWQVSDLPLGVWLARDLPQTWFLAWESARFAINSAVGAVLFDRGMKLDENGPRTDAPLPRGHVAILFAPDGDGGGTTEHRFDTRTGEILSAVVTLDPSPRGTEVPIVLHELGHVLGLDHDEAQSSIMAPYLTARPGKLSDADVKLLRALYGEAKKS